MSFLIYFECLIFCPAEQTRFPTGEIAHQPPLPSLSPVEKAHRGSCAAESTFSNELIKKETKLTEQRNVENVFEVFALRSTDVTCRLCERDETGRECERESSLLVSQEEGKTEVLEVSKEERF